MSEDNKWYKNTGVIITLALAITPVIISQALDVYIDIINSPTDFRICLDSVNISTENALTEAPPQGGSPQKVIRDGSKIIVSNCHRINPYKYEIFCRVVEQPPGINIAFEPAVLRLPDINESKVHAKISSEASTGDHQIEIEAVGGDGTKHSCYCIITVKKDSNIVMGDFAKDERNLTKLEDAKAAPPPTGVSQTQDSRPTADVRTVGVAQESQRSRPTGNVR